MALRPAGLIVAALAGSLASSAAPSAATAMLPCGVVDPVDRLLHCDRPETTVAAAGEPAPAEDAHAAAAQSGASTEAPLVDPTRLLVRFVPRTARAAAAREAQLAGGELERRIRAIGIDVVRADAARLGDVAAALRRSPLVRTVDRELLVSAAAVEPNDPRWSEQGGLRLTRFAEAWATTRGSPDVVVAVLDTGVSSLQPDLVGAVLPGYDAFNQDTDASDDHGHGTAVAGVIAARANNGIGIAGVCWLCRILPVKVLGANGYGATSTVAAGIVWAADHGADVINLSLGSPEATDALRGAVRYANERDALVVAAAGNSGATTPFYPAAEPDVLAVAATDESDRPYSWSNRGGWVSLAAPGCLATTTIDGGYGLECGTSFAAPIVAGLAGLVLGVRPTLTATTVAAVVRRAAVPIGAAVASGRVDAARTLSLLPPPTAQIARKTTVFRSRLTRQTSRRRFSVRVAEGAFAARVTRNDGKACTIELRAADGRVVGRAHGRRSVRIARTVASGLYSVRVLGAPGAFTLSLDYAAAAPQRPA